MRYLQPFRQVGVTIEHNEEISRKSSANVYLDAASEKVLVTSRQFRLCSIASSIVGVVDNARCSSIRIAATATDVHRGDRDAPYGSDTFVAVRPHQQQR